MSKFQLITLFLLSTLVIIFGVIAHLLMNISDNIDNVSYNISLLKHAIQDKGF